MDFKERLEIDLSASTMDCLLLMAEGNPGATSVLWELTKINNGYSAILTLDDMNIRGTQIWIGYKDYCNSDIIEFFKCVSRRDQSMVDRINEEGRCGNHIHKAVKSGGQFKREFLVRNVTSKSEIKRMIRPQVDGKE